MSTTPALAVALDALRTAQDDAPEELLRLLSGEGLLGFASAAANDETLARGFCPTCGAEHPERHRSPFKRPYDLTPAHDAGCKRAHWLRVFGGEAERQRQVDAAHEEALNASHRRGTNQVVIGDQTWTFSDDATAASMAAQINAECRLGAVATVERDELGADVVTINPPPAPLDLMPGLIEIAREGTRQVAAMLGADPTNSVVAGRSRVPPKVAESNAKRFRRGGRG